MNPIYIEIGSGGQVIGMVLIGLPLLWLWCLHYGPLSFRGRG